MDKKEVLIISRIEPFIERFKKYFELGHITFNESELKGIAEISKMIDSRSNTNFRLNCNSCIRDAIVLLSNYYDLNKIESKEEIKVEEIKIVEDKVKKVPKEKKKKD